MVRMLLRLPDELAKELSILAAENDRSRNSEMIRALREYVKKCQKQKNILLTYEKEQVTNGR